VLRGGHPCETGSNYSICRMLCGLQNWFWHTGDYFVVVVIIFIIMTNW